MLGWEFPPYFAGGVGIVCSELTKFLCNNNIDVTYIMPHGPKDTRSHVKLLVADNLVKSGRLNIKKVNSLLTPYITSLKDTAGTYYYSSYNGKDVYSINLIEEMYSFAEKIKIIAKNQDFDVIHAHDWTTFPAAVAAKEATKKPMIVHVHITEYDKSGNLGVNPFIYNIEKKGLDCADKVIAISNFTKNKLIEYYSVPENKIAVIHNGGSEFNSVRLNHKIKGKDKVVLFAGRMTLQKGPEFFIEAAKKALEVMPNIKFIMAGSGDMFGRMIDKVASYGLSDRFIFTGFYNRDEAEKLFSMADCFVMPSVSEPFGIVPLEAIAKGTPTIISKQSGISEVLKHTLKVDFWDVCEMASKMVAVLRYPELHSELREKALSELPNFSWDKPSKKCIALYDSMVCGG